jgi:glycosyltransferase involved in cell wall biosynthesis
MIEHKNSLVSVIIPTYNRLNKLIIALQSVISQNFDQLQIVIVDDASTDGTSQYLKIQYPNVLLIRNEQNLGAAAARNIALQHARGEFIAFMDSDDIWHTSYIRRQLACLDRYPGASAVFCSYIRNVGTKKIWVKQRWPRKDPVLDLVIYSNFIHTMSSFLIKRSVLVKVGLLREDLKICHDREFYIRLLKDHTICYNDQALLSRGDDPHQLTQDMDRWLIEGHMIIEEYFSGPGDEKATMKEEAHNLLEYRLRAAKRT